MQRVQHWQNAVSTSFNNNVIVGISFDIDILKYVQKNLSYPAFQLISFMKIKITSLLATALFLIFSNAHAQKLPNKQEISVRAPKNIKIDGNPIEWDNKFQAYNHATDIFYTLSNDDANLYLVVQATDPGIINKIVNGRISFTINKSGKKSDDNAVTISYPIFESKNRPNLNLKDKPEIIPGSAISLKQADSFMYVNNKRMTDRVKMIKVTGLKDIDTLISIYNDVGIKAAALFDNKMVYTCEISVSLKLIGLSVNDATKFNYHVVLNGIAFDFMPGVQVTRAPNGEITAINIHKEDALPSRVDQTTPTDFWAEYTLAKK